MNDEFIREVCPLLYSSIQCSKQAIEKSLVYYLSCGHKCLRDSVCCLCSKSCLKCSWCAKKPSLFKHLDDRCYIEDEKGYTIFCIDCREKTTSRFSVGGIVLCDKCKYNYIRQNLDTDCLELDGSIVCYICEMRLFDNKQFNYIKMSFEESYLSFCSSKCRFIYKTSYMNVDDYFEVQDDTDDDSY